ncbi:Uncharacterized protein APZ42_033203 [Daphnia magna]|uniref:Reverse transcriptase domain-containing protein n=1 Tax=Daphnia magna TaxID=35525 RepID=A0A164LAY0_9CRUS|nr:Uncharacterized protein APZ42_033203 [Daphnia magna]
MVDSSWSIAARSDDDINVLGASRTGRDWVFQNLSTHSSSCSIVPSLTKFMLGSSTAAVVSVASPSLQEKLGARRMGWDGPSVVMVNGQKAPPLGAFELKIEHRGMKASGKVILLEMRGIELLLGNDFLSQFKRLYIYYVPNSAELLLGELPIYVIEELEAVNARRLVTKTGRTLPPRAIVPVEIEATTLNEATWTIEPSEHLARAKGVTAGKVLVSDHPLGQVLMVNLTNRRAYLREGTVLGQIEAVEPSIVTVYEGGNARFAGRRSFRAQVASTLPPADGEKMVELLEEFDPSFALKEGELGVSKIAEHRINTGTAMPAHQSPYKSAQKERAIVQKQVDEMLSQSVIERSTSPWASPVVLVMKKEWMKERIKETFYRMGNASIFSTLDLESGYWQVPLNEGDKGSAPGTFQRMMNLVLTGLRWTICLVYLDDIIIYAADAEEHLVRVRQLLTALRKAGLKIKLVKCQFGASEFTHTAKPLMDMFEKGGCFVWEEVSFGLMKQALVSAATLAYPDFTRPFEIHPNACDYGLGAVLLQRINNIERPLAYASRLLSPKMDRFYQNVTISIIVLSF